MTHGLYSPGRIDGRGSGVRRYYRYVSDSPTRALGYIRLSRETEASTSPERQRDEITE